MRGPVILRVYRPEPGEQRACYRCGRVVEHLPVEHVFKRRNGTIARGVGAHVAGHDRPDNGAVCIDDAGIPVQSIRPPDNRVRS